MFGGLGAIRSKGATTTISCMAKMGSIRSSATPATTNCSARPEKTTCTADLGNDLLVAGAGIVNQLFGDEGDDRLIGSDEGSEDPNLFDTVFFGDILVGGAGDDPIFGLGGARYHRRRSPATTGSTAVRVAT